MFYSLVYKVETILGLHANTKWISDYKTQNEVL